MRIHSRPWLAVGAAVCGAILMLWVPAAAGAPNDAGEAAPEEMDLGFEEFEDFEILDAGAGRNPPGMEVYFGRLHILVIHFPIAWVWLAAIVTLVRVRRPNWIGCWDLVLVAAAAASFLPALATGWVHHLNLASQIGESVLMQRHKTLAFVAFGAVAAATILRLWAQRSGKPLAYRLAAAVLFAGAILVSVAAHFGGSMVYGEEFLRFWF